MIGDCRHIRICRRVRPSQLPSVVFVNGLVLPRAAASAESGSRWIRRIVRVGETRPTGLVAKDVGIGAGGVVAAARSPDKLLLTGNFRIDIERVVGEIRPIRICCAGAGAMQGIVSAQIVGLGAGSRPGGARYS